MDEYECYRCGAPMTLPCGPCPACGSAGGPMPEPAVGKAHEVVHERAVGGVTASDPDVMRCHVHGLAYGLDETCPVCADERDDDADYEYSREVMGDE